jgi:hypothetical protein
MEMVGSLLFAAGGTRPDIATATLMLSRHMAEPMTTAVKAAYSVLQYLHGTANLGIRINGPSAELRIEIYSDASFAPDEFERRSRTGYIVFVSGSPLSPRFARCQQRTTAHASQRPPLDAPIGQLHYSVLLGLHPRRRFQLHDHLSMLVNVVMSSLETQTERACMCMQVPVAPAKPQSEERTDAPPTVSPEATLASALSAVNPETLRSIVEAITAAGRRDPAPEPNCTNEAMSDASWHFGCYSALQNNWLFCAFLNDMLQYRRSRQQINTYISSVQVNTYRTLESNKD